MKKHFRFIPYSFLLLLFSYFASAQLVFSASAYMVISPGTQANPTTLVVTNATPAGITNNGTGWIVSENEFSQVQWNIGTNAGVFVMPFGYNTTDYLPITCNIGSASSGTGTGIKFATWHGSSWDNSLYEPSDVTNMTDFSRSDYSNDAVDRFWILQPTGYSTNPQPNITFTYIRSGAASEIATPNNITEPSLIAQRFNSTANMWDDFTGISGADVTSGNTGTVSSGNIPSVDFFRSWCLFNDSTLLTGINAPLTINNSPFSIYPNPGNGIFTVSGLTNGQVIELYNDLGQLMLSAISHLPLANINISDKANGVYLVSIVNKNGSIAARKKVVKMD